MDRDYVINIILKGTNLVSGEAKKMADDLESAFRRVQNASTNAIAGVPTRQRNELGQYTKEVERLGGAIDGLRRRYRQLDAAVESHRKGLAGVITDAIIGKQKRLADESGRMTTEVVRQGGALRSLRHEWRETVLQGEKLSNVFVGARRAISDLEHGVRDLTRAERLSRELGRGPLFNFGYHLGRGLNQALVSITRFNPALGFMSIALILAVNIITDFVAALTALASAAALAGAAIGGAFVAGLAQAIPVVGVAIVAMNRLTKVFEAVKAAENEQARAGESASQAADRRRAAVNRLADAQYALTQAHLAEAEAARSLTDAIRELDRERTAARENLVDITLAQRDAVLDEKDAVLSLIETRERLADLEADRAREFEKRRQLAILRGEALPTAVPAAQDTEIRRARLDIELATNRRREAEIALARAIEDAEEAQRLGVENAPNVVTARDNIRRASQQLADAQHNVAERARDVNEAMLDMKRGMQDTTPQADALKRAMEELDPAERRLFGIIQRVKKTWSEATRPISDSIVNAIGDALVRSERIANDPRLQRAFGNLGQVIGDQIRKFADFASSPEQRGFMAFFTDEAAKNAPRIRSILESLVVIVEKLAKAASPLLERLLIRLDKFLSGRAEGTNVDRLTKFFDNTEKYVTGLIRLGGAFFNLLGAIIQGAAGPGLESMSDITDKFNEWAKWIDEHPEEFREFFRNAIQDSYEWLQLIVRLLEAINALGDSEGFQMLIQFLQDTVVPVFEMAGSILETILSILGFVGKALGAVGLGNFARDVVIFIGAVGLLSKTIPGVGFLIRGLVRMITDTLLPVIGRAARALLYELRFAMLRVSTFITETMIPALGRLAASWLAAIGPVGWIALAIIAFAALITWLGKWDEILGIVMDTLKTFASIFTNVFKLIDDLVHGRWEKIGEDILNIFKSWYGTMVKIFLFLPRIWSQVFLGILEKLGILDDIKKVFSEFFDWLGKKWKGAWEGIAETFGGIWDGIIGKMKDVVNTLIDGINWVLRGIGLDSKQLDKWGGGKKATGGGPKPASATGFAEGGIVQPVPGGVYRVAEAGHPEAVIPLDPSKRGRAMSIMDAAAQVMGFQDGGVVVPQVPAGQVNVRGGSWLEKTIRLGAWLQRIGFSVSEHPSFGGVRGQHSRTGYHYSAQGALDVNRDGPDEMRWLDALNARLQGARQRIGIAELLWRKPDHFDHLHVALGAIAQRGQGLLSSLGIGDLWSMFRDRVRLPGIGEPGKDLLTGAGNFIRNSLWSWLKDQAGSLLSAPVRLGAAALRGISGGGGGSLQVEAAKSAGRLLAKSLYGWDGAEFSALDQLWTGESGWRWWALNRSSGAYGIPQSLPANKMASEGADWKTNPATQIRWGLKYIKQRYGSPSAALSAWGSRSPHWYGDGGEFVADRPTLIGVGEKGPEHVVVTPMAQGGIIDGGGPVARAIQVARQVPVGDRIKQDMARVSGAFAALHQFVSEQAAKMALALRRATVQLRGGVAVRVLSDLQVLEGELSNLRTGYQDLSDENRELTEQIKILRDRLKKTRNPAARAAIEKQIDELVGILGENEENMQANVEAQLAAQERIKEAQIAAFQASVDAAEGRFTFGSAMQSVRERISAITNPNDFGARVGFAEERRGRAAGLRAELEGLLPSAQTEEQRNALLQRIAELNLQEVEATQEIADLQREAFQFQVDQVNKTANRGLSLNSVMFQIAQIRGDIDAQKRLLEERQSILQTQRDALQALLATATDPDQIADLTQQLAENELAMLQNTEALEELRGSLQPQTWSSRAWQVFRTAVFTGMGGLLPQYQLPRLDTGGLVTREGAFWLHPGEVVRPAGAGGSVSGDTNVYISEPMQIADPGYLAARIGWELRNRR